MENDLLLKIENETRKAAEELCIAAKLAPGNIVVIGCSSSEVLGHAVGSFSSPETAEVICRALASVFDPKGIYIAAQCCEHLNRAIVIERAAVRNTDDRVNVVPQPKAGGSFAAAAYRAFREPIVLEEIRADAGLDIGMHLRRVAVPLRLSVTHIGEAILLAARTRPKYIGGARAVYDETLG